MLPASVAVTQSGEVDRAGMDDDRKSKQEVLDEVSRSASAYREQLLARELSKEKEDGMSATQLASTPFQDARKSLVEQKTTDLSDRVSATQVSYPNTGAAALSVVPEKMTSSSDSTTKIPPPPERQKMATAEAGPQKRVEPIAFSGSSAPLPSSASGSMSNLQDDLQQTISDWEQSTNQLPGSTQEVHQHMRLRLLYLLAGREESMLEAVPGATPVQQDYWSNQIFALSTFLDSKGQPHDKQRAAAALMHLDKAREKLAELGPLQVRNLTFVESVDGYGLYQPLTKQTFRPGQQVTLYAEVENFRSESTAEGQRSSLRTSYEVLDQQGHRVDAGQFPEIEDLCKSVRRDFHVQYGIALPTRIYPGKYELQLIVTDNLSNKLGQTSVPFEIAETGRP